jgi:hypothetical protein
VIHPNAIEILVRIVKPDDGSLSPGLARHFLGLAFTDAERARIDDLSGKARVGTLTKDESSELDSLVLLSHWIGILQAKARISLRNQTPPARA